MSQMYVFNFLFPSLKKFYFFHLLTGVQHRGHNQTNDVYFDTLHIIPKEEHNIEAIKQRAQQKMINLRYFEDGAVGVALDETTTMQDVDDLLWIFDCKNVKEVDFLKINYCKISNLSILMLSSISKLPWNWYWYSGRNRLITTMSAHNLTASRAGLRIVLLWRSWVETWANG